MDFTVELPLGRTYFNRYCKIKNCFLTINRSAYKKSHAIVFNDRDLPDHIAHMPYFKDRRPWQRWVYYNFESPYYARGYKPFFINAGMFNWSMTYHHNADIDIQYGHAVQRPIPRATLPDYHGRKDVHVTWAVSHCLNARMKYVQALSKYISIDIYGICGNKTCIGTNRHCWKTVFSRSMFYLSFENSVCAEYVTEKLWNPLLYGVVPVVLGGADYRKIAPPKSYIDARDFPSVKDLAEYLHKVSRDKNLYNSYMKWKLNWKIVVPRHWCNLCNALHDPNRPPKVYTTLSRDWDGLNRQCQPYPDPYEYLPKKD
ncbi:uncharacterized protein TRIADDRAFT_34075 [Trichoplax adhaerens]|uniref:Fucosyltransferase n=1 Tax=Trichoplax adhaerens TaxID=10228 RepID=B3SDP1_TRIAD|nr:hypothetical protein TRIADDRAFT_34075 [Trichoplax adhaerens]EDV19149.1 hypothetical protein TRIADDRAFT_34075 [Trichoplax adhaerens]|eukprot:XP_002118360.1 hypothetical protein TRIADDRAFT_34075 [Trichoplax adhaerens]